MTQTLTAPKNGIRFAGRTYREGEQLPEKYYKVQQSSRPRDPGSGQKDVPPNAGRAVLPHVFTFSGRISSLAKVYQYSDEALRHSIENAHMMLNDPVISGPLFARQQMVALLNWHVEPEDEKDEQQKEIAAKLTDILKQIPRFTEYRRVLTEAVWYGRQGLQNRYGFWHTSKGERYRAITGWEPVSGDKLVFRFDDGTGQFDPNQIGVKVTPALGGHDAIAGDRTYEPTPQGMAYFLEQWERALFVVHKHFIRDGEYEDPLSSGSIHGVGLRSFLYWVWYQKQETLAQLVELVERTGNGIIVLYYPSGNDEARKETEQIGKTMEHSNVLVMPYDHGDPDSNRIDNIAPNTAGLDALHSLIDDYYGDMITRFILGQTLSTKATATGLGSGVADLHKDSLMDIVRYDAVNLEETITKEVLHPLRNFNFPKFRQVNFRFVINTEANVPAEKLQAILQAWQMGAKLKASDLFEIIGLSMPIADDETLFNPQIVGAIEQMAQQRAQQAAGMVPGMPGGDPMQGDGGDPNQPPTDGGPNGDGGGPGDNGPIDSTGGPAPAQMSEPAADDPVAKLFGPILNSRRGSLRPVRYSRRDELSAIVAEAASQTDTNPSAEQVAAGNYRKGRFWWNGLEIVIETPRGASRKGKGWERELGDHYGYIRRTESERDGDHIDCYIGPEPDSEVVYVVDQVTAGGRFDEHKCMIGYTSQRDAVVAYRANYPSDWKVGPVTAVTARQFKAWLLAGDTNQPLANQVSRYAKRLKSSPGQKSLTWDEEKHPRAESGEFAPKGSGSVARPGADDSITAKKKQSAFWLGMNDDPDQGLLFGDKEEGKAKKEETVEKEATPKKKPRMHFKGDEAEYTGEMRDGFYVVKMLEGRFEGEEKLVTRPPEGFSGPDEKKLAEWKEQQEAFGRLHDLSKSEPTEDESEPAEPELSDPIEADSSTTTLDEPKATEPEDVALHAYRTGQPKAQAIREAMTKHGMNPDDWRETLRVAKAYDVHRMNGGAAASEAKDEPAKAEEPKAVASAMEQEPEPAPEAEAEAEDATEPISEPIADDTDEPEPADSPADNDSGHDFALQDTPEDATPREAAEHHGQQLDPDYEFARASAVPNMGEDLKGSARHKRNEWKNLQDAEASGDGDTFATRAHLQKQYPHELMQHVEEKPLVALSMHYALNKFPGSATHRDPKRMTEEEKGKARRQYVEEYHGFKAKAEELAQKHTESRPAIEELQRYVRGRIEALRNTNIKNQYGNMIADRSNDTANNLVSLSNSMSYYKPGKLSPPRQVNDFMQEVNKKHGLSPNDDKTAIYAEHAANVLEGKSLNSSLGQVGKKDKTFEPSKAYVSGKSIREGGRQLSAETAVKAVSTMLDDMGMRGVQWGNSVTDDERQHHGPRAAEAFMDLADAVGLSDADISLGGKLGLAIGARGHGNALAHYEGHTQVINLTRKSGVGSLAHEWGHAFDHSLRHFGKEFFSEDHVTERTVGKTPLHEAYAKLDDATRDFRDRIKDTTDMLVQNKQMSQAKAEYWREKKEIFARCFERFVQHKLNKQGRDNTYLVGLRKKNEDDVTNLWPTIKEAEEMAPAFDAIFEAFKEHGRPPEKVRRYNKRQGTPHRYAVRHAPKGGVQIRGKQYTGGQFIPSEEYDQADPATKSAIDQASGTATGALPNATGQLTSRFDAADEGTKIKAPSGTWTKTGDQWQHESGRTQGSAGLSQEFASGRSGGGVSGAHQQLNQIGQEEGQPRHRETLNESRVNGVVSHNSPDMTPDEHKSVGDWHAQQAEAFKQKAEGLPDNPKLRAEAQKQAQGHAGAAQWHQDEGARKHQEANPTIVPEHIAALDAAPAGSKVGEFTKDDSGAWKHPVGTKLDSHALAKSYGRKGKSEQLGQEIAKLPAAPGSGEGTPATPAAAPTGEAMHNLLETAKPGFASEGVSRVADSSSGLSFWKYDNEMFTSKQLMEQYPETAKLVAAAMQPKTSQPAGGQGGAGGPKQPKAHPLATLSREDRNNLKSVAGMYGINPGDKANLNRAANFSLLAARKIGLNPKGASKAEQVAHAVKFLASQQPRLESLVQTAQQLGYKGKAQHLVARSRGASEHIVKEAAKNGYQASGKFDKADLIGALQHLAAVKKPVSEAGPPQSPASGYGPSGDSQGRGPLSRTLGRPVDHGDSGARPSFHQVIAKLADSVGGHRNLWIAAGTVAALWFAFTHQQRRQFFDKAGQGGFNVIRYEE